nr:bifunctional diaminohydroxyphosphoribosylaminopyrimidine deaminase/5-amino-6-(5-phosphoribosylamino)uracil reductase RibD [Streptomyces rhizosphaericus]
MQRAIDLSKRALGHTSPHSIVGCVLMDRQGHTIGEGWRQDPNGPHAEIRALHAAGANARGATAVTTLEPCNHAGPTRPCAQALIDAGVTRVVYAVADPTTLAAGGGATLAAAGVDVECGLLAHQAAEANTAWLTSVQRQRPYVIWTYVVTLDGRGAASDSICRWVTSPQARADLHRLRAEADAVVVGSGTVRLDDPQLAARNRCGTRQPLRVVVVGSHGNVRPDARILDHSAPTLIAMNHAAKAPRMRERATAIRLPSAADGRGLDLSALLDALYERGVRSVLLEGGPTLAGAFLAAGFVDRIAGYLAPALLGEGPAPLARVDANTALMRALRVNVIDITWLGPDLRITATPQPPPPWPATATGQTRS